LREALVANQPEIHWERAFTPAVILLFFWIVAVALWWTTGHIFYLFNFGYLGTALGVGMGMFGVLPRTKKQNGRRLTQLLVGGYLLVGVGILAGENLQPEGLFFMLLAGLAVGAVIHYAVAKVVGPLLFGRGFCGWACWIAMVLDLLPFRRSPGWLRGPWGWLRHLHLALSAGLVATCYFGLRLGQGRPVNGPAWMLGGVLLWLAAGIAMACGLRDNRAFCKYLCPIPPIMKLPARLALLKIASDASQCNGCLACGKVCPMDIDVPEYARRGERILSAECILCQSCVNACARGALSVNMRLDAALSERLLRRS
jgi:ferredoxin-type protein NapH